MLDRAFAFAFLVLSLCVVPLDSFILRQGPGNRQIGASPRLSPSCAASPNGRPSSSVTTMATGAVGERLKQLDITLPEVAPAGNGNYVLHRRSGDTLYMSGHLPKAPDGTLTTGKV
ncbi:unnamed protein product, partial [Ectocarpus sp. 8 AP-2014]